MQLFAVFAVGATVAAGVAAQSTGNSACDAAIAAFTSTYTNCGFVYDATTKQTSVAAWTTQTQAVSCVCAALNANALYSCASVASAQSFIQSTNSLQSSCAALGGSGVSTTSDSSNSKNNSNGGSSSSGPSMGAIVGGVIGGIVVLGAIGAGVYFYSKKGKDAAPVPVASVPHNNSGYNNHSTFAEPPLPSPETKYPQSTVAYGQHPPSSLYKEPPAPASVYAPTQQYAPSQQYAPTGPYSPPSTSAPSTYAQSSAGEQSNLYQQQAFAAAPVRYNEPEKNSQLFNALSSAASTQQSPTSAYPPQGGFNAKQEEAYKETTFDTNEAVLWSAGQTAAWLQSLKYPAHIVQIFMEGHVDGQFLKVMAKNSVHCKEILSNDLGIKDVRIRALLADSICALFEETPAFAYAGGSAQGAAGGVAAPPGYSEF